MRIARRLGVVLLVASAGCGSGPASQPPMDTGSDEPTLPATGWYGLQDVSILLPAPAGFNDKAVLTLGSAGNGGPLLDTNLFSSLSHDIDAYGDWRVVAARIDPCFPDLGLLDTNPSVCRHQIRLIAQPLTTFGIANHYEFADTSLHLLYDLPQDQFDAMSAHWLALATPTDASRSVALGVHAQIAEEGLAGARATKLRSLIAQYCGPATLTQASFFSVVRVGSGMAWDFEAAHIAAGVTTPISIPNVNEDTQRVDQASATLFDQPSLPLVPLVALTDDAPTLQTAMQASLDIDNPTKFDIDTIDCASCHLANRLRSRAAQQGVSRAGLAAYAVAPFNLANDLDPALDVSETVMRGFGYNQLDPVWSQRTINESARVAAYFNAQLEAARGH